MKFKPCHVGKYLIHGWYGDGEIWLSVKKMFVESRVFVVFLFVFLGYKPEIEHRYPNYIAIFESRYILIAIIFEYLCQVSEV